MDLERHSKNTPKKNNPAICIGKVPVFWGQWHSRGICNIGDLYKDGNFMSYEDLTHTYKLQGKGHFWKYLQMRHCVTSKFKGVPENDILGYIKMPSDRHTASVFYKLFNHGLSGESLGIKLL